MSETNFLIEEQPAHTVKDEHMVPDNLDGVNRCCQMLSMM
jgi:hypothetical protein